MSVLEKIFPNDRNVLNIIIVGCGKVGTTLVKQLSEERHHITVIDSNSAVINTITNTYDVMGINGNASSYSILMEAGIESADLLISVTESDEFNLLCCTIANKMGNCSTIARVRNPDYGSELSYLREKLGISMIINPELEAATEIARLLRFPNALGVNSFAKGQVEMIRARLPKDFAYIGRTLSEFMDFIKIPMLICSVEVNGKLKIPNGSHIFGSDEIITFIATPKNAHMFFKKIKVETGKVSNAMIIGGGKTTYYLAKQLLDMGINIKIIEKDEHRCEELSVTFDKALIICGDGTDEELLMQEGIEHAEALITLTGIDEQNILLSVYAKRLAENVKTITEVTTTAFRNVVESFELDGVIYPRSIIAEMITAYVRAKKNSIGSNIETLYHIFRNRAEAIEFNVGELSPVTDIPICQLKLKDDLLIACINRQGKIIIPSGSDMICEGDTVIVVTAHTGFNDIRDILK